MSDNEGSALHSSLEHIRTVCKVIRVACLVCLVGFILCWVVFTSWMIAEYINATPNGVQIEDISYTFLFGVMVCVLFIVTLRIFSDIVAGETPFSHKQVKRLRYLGAAFLVFAAIELILSTSFYFDTQLLGQTLSVVGESASEIPSEFIRIDLTAILAALASYGLALIFKYGILLQEYSDETL